MRRRICVVTGTRAEYGLLYWVIEAIRRESRLRLQLLVTGTHLCPEFGSTFKEIEADGIPIDKRVEIILSSDSTVGACKAMGLGMISFGEAFQELRPDLVLLLGDRFETLAAATAATVCGIPIAHCHGGETTEGAIDEAFRHALTKMSHLHFTSTEPYRRRVIQLGEAPERVLNVGALGLESLRKLDLLDREAFEASIGRQLRTRSLLITFHPATLQAEQAEHQFSQLIQALSELRDTTLIFTKANADPAGRVINQQIDQFVAGRDDESTVAFASLGRLRYLSALKHVDGVVGNSSSGIIEAPSFRVGTLDVGIRQKGRIRAASVLHCEPVLENLREHLGILLSQSFRDSLVAVENPYDGGCPAERIASTLASFPLEGLLMKTFYDIPAAP